MTLRRRLWGLFCLIDGHRPAPCNRTVRDATHSRFELRCRRCGASQWVKTSDHMDNSEEQP